MENVVHIKADKVESNSKNKFDFGELKWIKKKEDADKYFPGRVLVEIKEEYVAVCFSDGSIKCDIKLQDIVLAEGDGPEVNVNDVVLVHGSEVGTVIGSVEKTVSCLVRFENGDLLTVPIDHILADIVEEVIPSTYDDIWVRIQATPITSPEESDVVDSDDDNV